jgi:hypothetical protein
MGGNGGIILPFLTSALYGVASFTPRPIYPQWKRSLYPLDRTLGGSQSRSGGYGAETNLARNRNPVVQPVARHYADLATDSHVGEDERIMLTYGLD